MSFHEHVMAALLGLGMAAALVWVSKYGLPTLAMIWAGSR